jgi:hypothetical protein
VGQGLLIFEVSVSYSHMSHSVRLLSDPKYSGVIFNVCLLDFYTTQFFTSTAVIIECISWLINVTNNYDARWKPGIYLSLFREGSALK